MDVIKVAIADDHSSIYDGLEKIINSHDDMKMIIKSSSGKELLQQLQNSKQFPDVILLDIEMPGMNGIETLAKINKYYPKAKVVIHSFHEEPYYILHLISKGICGYIQKNCPSGEVVNTIRKVHKNGQYFNPEVVSLMTERFTMQAKQKDKFDFENKSFTKTEIKIIEMICQEMTTQQIADFYGISFRTVESHRYSIFRKANVTNVLGLVKFAMLNGYYKLEEKK